MKNWVEEPYPLPNYGPYTNPKFHEIQRRDSMFIQNTKEFFVIFLPIVTIFFVVLNRLFYYLFKIKASNHIRLFSFWLYLLVLTILQNCQSLFVYSIYHFFNIFSFDFETKALHFLSLFLIALVFLGSALIFPMTLYFYRDKAKYFLSNMNFSKLSLITMFIRFFIKPLIESIIHICLYYHPNTQKLLLCLTLLFFVSLFLVLKVKIKIFLIKGLFWL